MVNSKSCIICGSKLNLFSFPNDESERKRWATAVKMKPEEITYSTDKICKRHFLANQFKYASQKRLKPDAVPTFNVPNENNEPIENTAEECKSTENQIQERLDMCLVCGYVSAPSFHRFPKNCLLKLQWAKFCEVSIGDIQSYHRLCNKHFVSVHDRHKFPTLYPKKHFQCNETLRDEEVLPIIQETIENIPVHRENNENLRECSPVTHEERIMEIIPVDCGNIVPECSATSDLVLGSNSSEVVISEERIIENIPVDCGNVVPEPLIYFKCYGDIKPGDVKRKKNSELA